VASYCARRAVQELEEIERLANQASTHEIQRLRNDPVHQAAQAALAAIE